MLLTIAAAILVLGVLIFVHELGHFWAAKAVGIGVPRFSIGLGPATPVRFTRGGTEYVLSWIPFGGYVKMASKIELESIEALEGGEAEDYPPDQLFESKSLPARILVISAGVIMNALFAWGAYAFIAAYYGEQHDPMVELYHVAAETLPAGAEALANSPLGVPVIAINGSEVETWTDVEQAMLDPRSDSLVFEFEGRAAPIVARVPGTAIEERVQLAGSLVRWHQPKIGALLPGEPAADAGLQTGDVILFAGGDSLRAFYDLTRVVEPRVGQEIEFVVDRDGEILTFAVTPAAQEIEDPVSGETREVGRIGVGVFVDFTRVRYSPIAAVGEGFNDMVNAGSLVMAGLKGMVTAQISPRELGGPILIGQLSGQVVRAGLEVTLAFTAFLSINLAILNLLPIPVLDGGHLVFLFLEGVRGKPLSEIWRIRFSQFGLTVLLALMLFAVANDLVRVFL